ncbi:hypothetical protein PLESTB_000542300 [Pleodorina starrii]|uniref:Uncharacterized protein n=1 Tax=Pleodorina starrii TaxID=330485 RepID=A0A9W6F0I1_9CHLO|nr:hypothetical protein PLESTB_000542300 [Pleodorina starrii]GLC77348.1 hypothetical protein PLESTF_001923400 [Pleodorina starrii]
MFAMKPRCPAEAEGEASDAFGQLLLVRCGKYAEQRAIKEGSIPLHALAEEDTDLMAAQLGISVRQTAGAARAVPGRKGAGRSAAGAGGLPAGHLAAEDRRGHDDRGPRREGARSHDGGQSDAWPAVCDAGEAQAAAQAQADVFRAGSRSLCTRMAHPRPPPRRPPAGPRWWAVALRRLHVKARRRLAHSEPFIRAGPKGQCATQEPRYTVEAWYILGWAGTV